MSAIAELMGTAVLGAASAVVTSLIMCAPAIRREMRETGRSFGEVMRLPAPRSAP